MIFWWCWGFGSLAMWGVNYIMTSYLHAALYLFVSSILTWMSLTWSKSRSQPRQRPPEPCTYHSHCTQQQKWQLITRKRRRVNMLDGGGPVEREPSSGLDWLWSPLYWKTHNQNFSGTNLVFPVTLSSKKLLKKDIKNCLISSRVILEGSIAQTRTTNKQKIVKHHQKLKQRFTSFDQNVSNWQHRHDKIPSPR